MVGTFFCGLCTGVLVGEFCANDCEPFEGSFSVEDFLFLVRAGAIAGSNLEEGVTSKTTKIIAAAAKCT